MIVDLMLLVDSVAVNRVVGYVDSKRDLNRDCTSCDIISSLGKIFAYFSRFRMDDGLRRSKGLFRKDAENTCLN